MGAVSEGRLLRGIRFGHENMTEKKRLSPIRANASNGGFDLARLRKKLGIKAAAVAREMGISAQGYSELERSGLAGTLSIGRLRGILDILGFALEAIDIHTGPEAAAANLSGWTPPNHYARLPYEIDLDVEAYLNAHPDASRDLMPTRPLQANVRDGLSWAVGCSFAIAPELLTEHFACSLHREMFYRVHEQAGSLRAERTAFGVSDGRVRDSLGYAMTLATYEVGRRPFDTIALALHHQLATKAHFAVGSTAHARAMADLVLLVSGCEPFTWGETLAVDRLERVRRYRTHLLVPDAGSRGGLEALAFARS